MNSLSPKEAYRQMDVILAIPRIVWNLIMIAYLMSVIVSLKAQIAAKNIEIARLKGEIAKLKHIIDKFAAKCYQAAESSAKEMKRGNVPQGRYGYLKGTNDLANVLLKILGSDEVRGPGRKNRMTYRQYKAAKK